MSEVGAAIGQALAERGMTQSRLARQLDIDPGSVSRWVRGRQNPNADNVARLEEVLEVDLTDASHADTNVRSAQTYEVFVATPMAAFASDAEYEDHRTQLLSMLEVVERCVGRAYWAGRQIGNAKQFDASDIGDIENLRALRNSRVCLFVHLSPTPLATSALIEIGLALGWRKPTTVLAPSARAVPYMIEGLPQVSGKLNFLPETRFYKAASPDEANRLFEKHGTDLFGA